MKAVYHHGKLATCKVLEHFASTTPVVEKCDDPRCFLRLVIVQKESLALLRSHLLITSYRVTVDDTDQTLFEISSKYATSRN